MEFILLKTQLNSLTSLGHLVLLDGVQKLLRLRIVREVVPHRLKDLVEVPRQRGLHVSGVQRLSLEVRLHLLVLEVILISAVRLTARHAELAAPRDDDVFDVLEARVAL